MKILYYDIKQLKFVKKIPDLSGIVIKETPVKRLLSLIKNIDLDFFNFEVYGDYDLLKIEFEKNEFDEDEVKELIESRAQMLYWRKRTDNVFENIYKKLKTQGEKK